MGDHHINEEMMGKFLSGQTTGEEEIEILTHASSCEFCSERLTLLTEKQQPMAMPRNLRESILRGTDRIVPRSPKKQIWFYSMKVCAAMAAAIVILFATSFREPEVTHLPRQNVQTEMPKPGKSLTEKLGNAVDRLTWKIYTEMYL
ncbi:MAG: hypothetical protein SO016_07145 [Lachnospiraceae bacterium]|nr:hypothetical protein [Robinsoniella sp.]MDY3766453.1 hypothetical protein [Lachnospiraceae bacterium]